MSHLRPEEKVARHRLSSCRKGHHAYGEVQRVGGGITRQVCEKCADVTIDLTGADDLSGFARPGRRPTLANFKR